MKIFSKDVFEFMEARIVCGNEGVGVGIMGDLGVYENGEHRKLFGYKEWRITSGDKGLGEVGCVDVKVIRVTIDLPPIDSQKGGGAFGG